MRKGFLLTVALAATLVATPGADVKTTERTQVKFEGMLGRVVGLFGGSKPMSSTVAVSGDRKATLDQNGGGRIVDLGEEKIYYLNGRNKTYTITTFEELRREIKEAQEEARKNAEKSGEKPAEQTAPEFEVDFDVKETGQTKQLAGHNTRQVISTVTLRQKGKSVEEGGGLILTSDMWMAPRIAAVDEIAAFERKFAEKVYGEMAAMTASQLAALLAMHPGFKQAQERLAKEGGKLQGTALMTTLTLESVKDPAAQASNEGGGGLAGRLLRRNQEKPGTRNKVFTSTHETLTVAASASAADVAIPADFKEKK